MYTRLTLKMAACCTVVLFLIFGGKAFCQSDFERAMQQKTDSLLTPEKDENPEDYLVPDDAPQTTTIPSGWGGYGTYLFGGIGGVYPQVYLTRADLIAFGGACVGNPFKAVNLAVSINMTDVHRFRDFSGNFMISRVVAAGSSISVGGLQLFASEKLSDAPGQTFYFAFSHAVQSLPSQTPGASRLTYTIGIGNGRFYLKSPDDIAAGRGKNGTGVFGSVSYEVIQHVNLIAEWSGLNLGVSAGLRPFKLLKMPLSFGVGATNLTRYSGDKPALIASIGLPLSLNR
ncbi:MAG TPA: hypothetical protein VFE53_04735 [Mucilaginibacter sp.]|nr:hypothetical protein [Mucilaginibacter sp.]